MSALLIRIRLCGGFRACAAPIFHDHALDNLPFAISALKSIDISTDKFIDEELISFRAADHVARTKIRLRASKVAIDLNDLRPERMMHRDPCAQSAPVGCIGNK